MSVTDRPFTPPGTKPPRLDDTTAQDAWYIKNSMHGKYTGTFIMSNYHTILCRIGEGRVWLFDKATRRQIGITLEQLKEIAG